MGNQIVAIVLRFSKQTAPYRSHIAGRQRKYRPNAKQELDSWSNIQLKYQSLINVCIFATFIIIVITTGVLIVYFTSPKEKNRICQFNFQKSTKQIDQYDSRPYHISAGDFNHDDHLDVVVANYGTDNIGIFLNDRNGTFSSQITYFIGYGSRPNSVAVGDLNNDTHLDVVVANFGINNIGVLFGYGNGSFANPIYTSLNSSQPLVLLVIDFNNDTMLDVIVVNYGTLTIAILLGENNGYFRIDQHVYAMGYDSIPYSIAVADLNQDNQLDIIAVNYGTSELAILLSITNQSFVLQKYWTGLGSHPSSVAVGYIDNDTSLDIAVAYSSTSSIGIFLGTERGTFINQATYFLDTHSRPQYIAVVDFNNDTQTDIIVLDSEHDNILVLKGYGNGSFSIITKHSTGYQSDPSAFVIGHFDNDEQLDIAISNNGTNNILLLTSYRNHPVTHHIDYESIDSIGANSIDIIDFNHDNYLDIVICDGIQNYIGIFLNLGNGTFKRQSIHDMNEFLNQNHIVAGDINNDGHPDIVTVMIDIGIIGILLGYGNGSFAHGQKFPIGKNSTMYSVRLDDLNNDGNLDITISSYDTGDIGFFWGFGNGTFTKIMLLDVRVDFYAKFVQIADINSDGILDVVAAVAMNEDGIAIFLGYGNESFHSPLFVSTDGDFPYTLTTGDVNNDHQLDIVYVNRTLSYISVLLGHGNGSFKIGMKYFTIRRGATHSVSLGYYNDDAFLDIAVSLIEGHSIYVYLGIGNGSFEIPIILSTGSASIPREIIFADLDNDHQQDITVGDVGLKAIQIFFVQTISDFTHESSRITGSSPHSVFISIGDLNNNSRLDIAIANSGTDQVELRMDYTNGTFMNNTILAMDLDSRPQSVSIADFNQDHLLDIAVVNSWSDEMIVFLGLGDGSFATRYVYSIGAGSAPNYIITGDLNKDGRTDIITVNEDTSNIGVFVAYDFVSFTSHFIDLPGSNPYPVDVVMADLNNDDQRDIAVIYQGLNNIGIYFGYGNGTFAEQIIVPIEEGSWLVSLATDDFNKDGYLDLVVPNMILGNIGVYLGYGNGSFKDPWLCSAGPMSWPISVAIVDFDNDSQLDIIATVGNGTMNGDIWIFFGNGNGSFRSEIVHRMLNYLLLIKITIADLNNDKFSDIVFAEGDGNNICILLGSGNGSIANIIKIATGEKHFGPALFAFGDFNQDKTIDIVVVNQNSKGISIFFNYGNGSFSSKKSYSINFDALLISITVTDVNNDTNLDILVSNNSPINTGIVIFYGYGNGHFTSPNLYSTGLSSQPKRIVTSDLNNDGKIDLVTYYHNRGNIALFIQEGHEPFGQPALFSTGNQSHPNSIALEDFNNDSYIDIAVTNSATNTIGILLGYGNGDFANQITYSTGINSFPSAISANHFNNDDHLDLAVVNTADHSISIFRGHGNGSFGQLITFSTGIDSFPVAIDSNDMNRDGHIDLIVANRGSNEVLIFIGMGNGTFFEAKRYSIGYNTRPQAIAIGDINNDNMLDIAVANDGAGYVDILLQTC